jgi:microfibrillar-associated protein 1
MAQDTEEAIKKKEQEAEERRQQSHNMVADTIKRELLESTSNKVAPLASLTRSVRSDPRGERSRNP